MKLSRDSLNVIPNLVLYFNLLFIVATMKYSQLLSHFLSIPVQYHILGTTGAHLCIKNQNIETACVLF